MIKAIKSKAFILPTPKRSNAKFYPRLTYDEALDQRLNVMDTTALVLCRDNNVPMRVMIYLSKAEYETNDGRRDWISL